MANDKQQIEIELTMKNMVMDAVTRITNDFDSLSKKIGEGSVKGAGGLSDVSRQLAAMHENTKVGAVSLTNIGNILVTMSKTLMAGAGGPFAIAGTAAVAAVSVIKNFVDAQATLKNLSVDIGATEQSIVAISRTFELLGYKYEDGTKATAEFGAKVKATRRDQREDEIYKYVKDMPGRGRGVAERYLGMVNADRPIEEIISFWSKEYIRQGERTGEFKAEGERAQIAITRFTGLPGNVLEGFDEARGGIVPPYILTPEQRVAADRLHQFFIKARQEFYADWEAVEGAGISAIVSAHQARQDNTAGYRASSTVGSAAANAVLGPFIPLVGRQLLKLFDTPKGGTSGSTDIGGSARRSNREDMTPEREESRLLDQIYKSLRSIESADELAEMEERAGGGLRVGSGAGGGLTFRRGISTGRGDVGIGGGSSRGGPAQLSDEKGKRIDPETMQQAETLGRQGDVAGLQKLFTSKGYHMSGPACGIVASAYARSAGFKPPEGGAIATNWHKFGEAMRASEINESGRPFGSMAATYFHRRYGGGSELLKEGQTGGHVMQIVPGDYNEKTQTVGVVDQFGYHRRSINDMDLRFAGKEAVAAAAARKAGTTVGATGRVSSTGTYPTEAELSDKSRAAGERFNNPFNMWHDKYAEQQGGKPGRQITQFDTPAVFPSKEAGAAAAIRKMAESPLYSGKSMDDLITKWVSHGGRGYAPIIEKMTGIPVKTKITPEFLASDDGMKWLKAMARYETRVSEPYPLSDEQWKSARATALNKEKPSEKSSFDFNAAHQQYQAVVDGKAGGGPVLSGRSYLVGEHGPEIMVPEESGNIVSNRDLIDRLSSRGNRGTGRSSRSRINATIGFKNTPSWVKTSVEANGEMISQLKVVKDRAAGLR